LNLPFYEISSGRRDPQVFCTKLHHGAQKADPHQLLRDRVYRKPRGHRKKDSLEYYNWLARLADKGEITSIFFADTYAAIDTYEGRGDASFRGRYAVAQLDPVVFVGAMVEVSKNVSFGIRGVRAILPYVTNFLPSPTSGFGV
jgi:alkanesulfonate monooxygenase SsuD/methylene tetrahydromethanopterin reductase-like flavin-dependent oxidoreductase (luciferase family)